MSKPSCPDPIRFEEMIDYELGELPHEDEDRIEEHLFACPACARRMEEVREMGDGVARSVKDASVAVVVNNDLVDLFSRQGLTLREYRAAPGETVPCSAGPEDYTVLHLNGNFEGLGNVTIGGDFVDLGTGIRTALPARAVDVDRKRGEVVLLLPGAAVRGYPRSIWTFQLEGSSSSGSVEIGTFVLDHTPA